MVGGVEEATALERWVEVVVVVSETPQVLPAQKDKGATEDQAHRPMLVLEEEERSGGENPRSTRTHFPVPVALRMWEEGERGFAVPSLGRRDSTVREVGVVVTT